MHRFSIESVLWIVFIAFTTLTRSEAQNHPEEITLKAGVIPSTSFSDFQADLLDRLVEIALNDNVTLTVEKQTIQELYGPNLDLISPDCTPGETVGVNGVMYSCSDFDFLIGDYWPNPERYNLVDFTPPWLTTSVSTMKYTEKTKNPNLDVTTLTEATRSGAPVCTLESSYSERLVTKAFPAVNILHCTGTGGSGDCLSLLNNEECQLLASDELYLRSLQAKYPYYAMTGEHLVRQLLAWPMRKSLDPKSSFLLNKWIYAAISNQVIDELFFEYYEKKLCPIGTAGTDCELPCDPDNGSSNAQGQCVCTSIRWTGDDCSVDVPEELNLIPAAIKGIAYGMFVLNCLLVIVGGIWLRVYRDRPEVNYSQPGFLALVLIGCLVSSSSIVAMVQEDEGDGPVHACIAIPWLYSVGFSITFGTLFAKIRRVYGIFAQTHQSATTRGINSRQRANTSFQDTLSTIGKVLLVDVVVLLLWTSVDPLYWKRDIIQQDQFGFTLESQGYCVSEHWVLFLGVLVILHIALCAVACYMCYVSRNIPSRYSEHKYLTIAMVSNLQLFIIGVPLSIITEDDPAAEAFVRSTVAWMSNFVVLTLIFGNLMYAVHSSKSVEVTGKEKRQMSGMDKRKVSEALKSFEPRSVAPSINRKGSSFDRSEESEKNKPVVQEVSIESDIESVHDATSSPRGGTGQTYGTSGSFYEEKEPEVVFSEISLSGFEISEYEVIVPVTITSGAKSTKGQASRWVPSPNSSSSEKRETSSPYGPSIPTREETVFDQPEERSGEFGELPSKLPTSNSCCEAVDEVLEESEENSQQHSAVSKRQFQDTTLDVPQRLSSIAELEWSDDEDNLTNQTPPAMLVSARPEKAPVMPKRLPELRESPRPEQAPVMPRRCSSEVLDA